MQQIKPGERCFQLCQINWVAWAESCVALLLPVAVARWCRGGGITYVLGTLPLLSSSAESPNNPPPRPGSPRSLLVREWQMLLTLLSKHKKWIFFFCQQQKLKNFPLKHDHIGTL